jgi:DNA-binding CsgD family transcriptional regulator
VRFLTLVGAGGVGKSRLAAEIVPRRASRYPDGVIWVELVAGWARVLTAREREIARLLARGSSNSEITGDLSLSERTAEAYLRNMRGKLGLASRSRLIAWAMYQA